MHRLRQSIAPLIALAWIIFILIAYHPLLLREHRIGLLREGVAYLQVWILNLTAFVSPDIWNLGVGALFMLAMFSLGHSILRRFHFFRGINPLEEIFFASTLGLFLLSQLLMIAGIAGVLYKAVIRGLVYGLAVLLVPGTVRYARRNWNFHHSQWGGPLRMAEKAIVLTLVWVTSFTLIGAMKPEIDFDGLVYHLSGPRFYLEAHRFHDIPEILETVFPKNIEMIFLAGLALRDELTVKAIVFFIGLLTVIGILAMGQRYFGRTTGLLAALIFLMVPVVAMEMQSSYIDVPMALFVVASFYALVLWFERRDQGWFVLSALGLAFLMGAKYTASFNVFAAMLVATVALRSGSNPMPWATISRWLLVLELVALVGFLPWSYYLYIYTGDPVFPYLSADPLFSFMALFEAPRFGQYNRTVVMSGQHRWGLPPTPANMPRILWGMHLDDFKFNGIIGPFFLALLPLGLIVRPRSRIAAWLALYAGVYFALWVLTIQSNRYLIPILPFACLLAAGIVQEATGRAAPRTLRGIFVAILVIMMYLEMPFNFKMWQSGRFFYAPLIERYQFESFLDFVSKEKYLAYHFWSMPAIEYLNRARDPKKVFYVGFHDGPPLYYMKFPVIYNELEEYNRLLAMKDPESLWARLKELDVTHILVEDGARVQTLVGSPESQFVRHYTRTVLQTNGATVLEVSGERIEAARPVVNVLDHLDRPTSLGPMHSGMVWGYGAVLTNGSEASSSLTVPSGGLLQLTVGTNHRFSPDPVRAQVVIRAQNGTETLLFDREFNPREIWSDRGWVKPEISLARWESQPVQLIFRNASESGRAVIAFPLPIVTGR